MVLAYDEKLNPGLPGIDGIAGVVPAQGNLPELKPVAGKTLQWEGLIRVAGEAEPKKAIFVPFAEAGATGGQFRVWLPTEAKAKVGGSILSRGTESRSREGNVAGSIVDGDPESFVVTFDGAMRDEDWFAVALAAPETIKRIVYMHGRTFHDGGWFDASAGKPKVQVQREKGGQWETVGTLDGYPATTAANSRGIADGQAFTLRLKDPIKAAAVRVLGKPASGDAARQAFASCAEIQAFPE